MSASPVPTRITLVAGLVLPGWMAIDPTESVAWSSVTGAHETLDAVLLAALLDSHTPPCAPPIKIVFPLGSAGSMATAVARPATWW